MESIKGTESYPLLREVYAIIDGIPSERFNLRFIAQNHGGHGVRRHTSINPHNCGTIACAAGWLGMHPKFRTLGIVTHESGCLLPNAYSDGSNYYCDVVATPLGLTKLEAKAIFAVPDMRVVIMRDEKIYDIQPRDWRKLSSKEIFQQRVKNFLSLKAKGAL